MRKIQFDEKRLTVAQNTVKFARIFRAKNENLHAAVQQKYQECISKTSMYILNYGYIFFLKNSVI